MLRDGSITDGLSLVALYRALERLMRYWEDFEQGETVELGSYEITREEMLEFARKYDPQPFHVDEEAASAGPFGGLAAERLAHGGGLHAPLRGRHPQRRREQGLARDRGAALDGARPARRRPDGRVRVVETYPSERRADRGTVITQCELLNQDGTVVMTMRGRGHFRRRPQT